MGSWAQSLLKRRADLTQAALRREHGSRARYVAGCHCSLCRAANCQYNLERMKARRAGDCRELVPADAAREHLLDLSRNGVGIRAVADASDLNREHIRRVYSGEQTQVRRHISERILAVDQSAISDHALVPVKETRELIRRLVRGGYTKTWIASQLGLRMPKLSIPQKWITAHQALRIARLYGRIQAGKVSR